MGESNQKQERRFDPELLKKGLRCDLDQYEMLKRCSENLNEGIVEWNQWRNKHIYDDIFLEGANLSLFYLRGANLDTEVLCDAHTGKVLEFHGKVYLKDAHLESALLEGARLFYAHLENVRFDCAHIENANLRNAHLERAFLIDTDLEGANLSYTHLQGANFKNAIVNGSTVLWYCEVDRDTDFRGVSLDVARIAPSRKQLMEYNVRRMNWEWWYKEHWFWRWPVRAFWAMSDYGRSTLRVIGVFFLLAFLFAGIYMNCAYWRPPGIIDNLIVEPAIEQEMSVVYYFWLALVRPIYFSIVTMTTLGFGDMYANKGSVAGHVILAVQVILGYVLLGALITRFAVLFTAGGPAGKFAKQKKKVDSVSPDNGIRGRASTE